MVVLCKVVANKCPNVGMQYGQVCLSREDFDECTQDAFHVQGLNDGGNENGRSQPEDSEWHGVEEAVTVIWSGY